MTENSEETPDAGGRRRGPLIALFAGAVLVVGAAAFAIAQQPGSDSEAESTATSTSQTQTVDPTAPATSAQPTDGDEGTDVEFGTIRVLDEPKSGQEAIDALGDKIDVVAKRNRMTVDELEHLLLTDSTVHISVTGSIYYRDTHTPQG